MEAGPPCEGLLCGSDLRSVVRLSGRAAALMLQFASYDPTVPARGPRIPDSERPILNGYSFDCACCPAADLNLLMVLVALYCCQHDHEFHHSVDGRAAG